MVIFLNYLICVIILSIITFSVCNYKCYKYINEYIIENYKYRKYTYEMFIDEYNKRKNELILCDDGFIKSLKCEKYEICKEFIDINCAYIVFDKYLDCIKVQRFIKKEIKKRINENK